MSKIIGRLDGVYLDSYRKLLKIQETLCEEEPRKRFTIDGNIIGDIGEIMAEKFYQIALHKKQKKTSDAFTTDQDKIPVQIKCSFIGTRYTYRKYSGQDILYLALQIHPNGDIEEIYNGDNNYIQGFLVKEPGSIRTETTRGVSKAQLLRANAAFQKEEGGRKVMLRNSGKD
ncbi:DUF6998 domain-containing protein [Phaeodactylibacter xiamenensis]|uniref:DUF6998 domain-containing protein n=1 Tax=Phaeodactylibacter xiamenensis TaxID=1524460 RepID=UPI003CCB744F